MILLALFAVATGTQASDVKPKPIDADAKIICRNLTRTGSRMAAKRVCLSAYEWRMTAARAQRDLVDTKTHSQMERVPGF